MKTFEIAGSKNGPSNSDLDSRLAWIGVVADPARHVDRAIESIAGKPPHSVLEVGPYATVDAARLAAIYPHAMAVGERGFKVHREAPAVSGSPFEAGQLPLPDQSVDRAVARASLVGHWGLDLAVLLHDLERVVRRPGLAVGVHCLFDESDLGLLASEAIGQVRATELEAIWTESFANRRFDSLTVSSFWRAPGRSILRRVLELELGGERIPIPEKVVAAELSCTYRVFFKHIGA